MTFEMLVANGFFERWPFWAVAGDHQPNGRVAMTGDGDGANGRLLVLDGVEPCDVDDEGPPRRGFPVGFALGRLRLTARQESPAPDSCSCSCTGPIGITVEIACL